MLGQPRPASLASVVLAVGEPPYANALFPVRFQIVICQLVEVRGATVLAIFGAAPKFRTIPPSPVSQPAEGQVSKAKL